QIGYRCPNVLLAKIDTKGWNLVVPQSDDACQLDVAQGRHRLLILEERYRTTRAILLEELFTPDNLLVGEVQGHDIGNDIPAFLVVQAGERRHEALDIALRNDGIPAGRGGGASDLRQTQGGYLDVELYALFAIPQAGFPVAGG